MLGERESRRQLGNLAAWDVRTQRRYSLGQLAGERRDIIRV